MYDILNVLAYGGIAILVILLVVFEIREGGIGKNHTPQNGGYEYYTEGGNCLRIKHSFGTRYKVYICGYCPVPTKKDRFGAHFTSRARSASEAEFMVDGLYRRCDVGIT